MKCLIVFSSANTHWLSSLLHKDTRHVSIAIYDDRTRIWIEHDVTAQGHIMQVVCDGDYDIVSYFENEGREVYALDVDPQRRINLPFLLNNCVGMVKAMAGLDSWALTPRQLRRHVRSLPSGDASCASYALT